MPNHNQFVCLSHCNSQLPTPKIMLFGPFTRFLHQEPKVRAQDTGHVTLPSLLHYDKKHTDSSPFRFYICPSPFTP